MDPKRAGGLSGNLAAASGRRLALAICFFFLLFLLRSVHTKQRGASIAADHDSNGLDEQYKQLQRQLQLEGAHRESTLSSMSLAARLHAERAWESLGTLAKRSLLPTVRRSGLGSGIINTGNDFEEEGNLYNQCEDIALASDPCEFVRENCTEIAGLIDYRRFYYCDVAPQSKPAVLFLFILFLFFLFLCMGVAAEEFFVPTLSVVSEQLALSENVAGVTFLAIGNGSPDIFSAYSAISSGSHGLALGEILGGGLFVSTVVVGCIAILSPFKVTRRPFLRDVGFYFISVVALILICMDGKVHLWESCALVMIYVAYVGVVIFGRKIYQHQKQARLLEQGLTSEEREEEEPLLSGRQLSINDRDPDGGRSHEGLGLTDDDERNKTGVQPGQSRPLSLHSGDHANDHHLHLHPGNLSLLKREILHSIGLIQHPPAYDADRASIGAAAGGGPFGVFSRDNFTGFSDDEDSGVETDSKRKRRPRARSNDFESFTPPMMPTQWRMDAEYEAYIHRTATSKKQQQQQKQQSEHHESSSAALSSSHRLLAEVEATTSAAGSDEMENGPVRSPRMDIPEIIITNAPAVENDASQQFSPSVITPRRKGMLAPPSTFASAPVAVHASINSSSSSDNSDNGKNHSGEIPTMVRPFRSDTTPSTTSSTSFASSTEGNGSRVAGVVPFSESHSSGDHMPSQWPPGEEDDELLRHGRSSGSQRNSDQESASRQSFDSYALQHEAAEPLASDDNSSIIYKVNKDSAPTISSSSFADGSEPNYARYPLSSWSPVHSRKNSSVVSVHDIKALRRGSTKGQLREIVRQRSEPLRRSRANSILQQSPQMSRLAAISPSTASSDAEASPALSEKQLLNLSRASESEGNIASILGKEKDSEHTGEAKGAEAADIKIVFIDGSHKSQMDAMLRTLFPSFYLIGYQVWWKQIISFLQAPMMFCMACTVPVILDDVGPGWNKWITLVQLTLAPVYVSFAVELHTIMIYDVFPVWALALIIGLSMATVVAVMTRGDQTPKYYNLLAYFAFVMCILWIYLIANEVVGLLESFGDIFGISDAILGLTVLALGNCIADTISNITIARMGYGTMAVSACFGSPLLYMLIGVGVSTFIVNLQEGEPFSIPLTPTIYFSGIGLAVSLFLTMILVPAMGFGGDKRLGTMLIVMYLAIISGTLVVEMNLYNNDR